MATKRTERVVTVDRLAEQLAAVELAAAKLAASSHGRRDACGGEIGADRLAALPAAALCLTCKKNRRAGGNRASAQRPRPRRPRGCSTSRWPSSTRKWRPRCGASCGGSSMPWK